jgi:translation elongation factor EF-1beta
VNDANRLADLELVIAFGLNAIDVTVWGDPKQLQPFS